MSLREYIEARSIPVPFAGCWLWLASLGSHGYGNARYPGGPNTTAHRVAYEAFKGPIAIGLLVQHSCDNKWCVNPDHLSLGTDRSNSDDKHRKGRANLESRRFRPHPLRKLTDAQVVAIRMCKEPHRRTAMRFGVDDAVIQRIRRGQHYREVGSDVVPSLLPLLPADVDRLNTMLAYAANEEISDDERDAYEASKDLEQLA